MSNEVIVAYLPGQTNMTFSVYFDSAGTITARETDTSLTEEPADSGIYKGSPGTIENNDIVIGKKGTDIVAEGQYRPEVNTVLIEGGDASDAINTECDTAISDYGPNTTTPDNANVVNIHNIVKAGGDGDAAAIKAKTDNLPADPASETNVDANETKIDTIDAIVDFLKNCTEGDAEVDTDQTPWQLVLKNKTTQDVLVRKNLKDVDGNNLTSERTIVGQHKEP